MNPADWKAVLTEIYEECRDAIGWAELVVLHDDQDAAYFALLDQMTGRVT